MNTATRSRAPFRFDQALFVKTAVLSLVGLVLGALLGFSAAPSGDGAGGASWSWPTPAEDLLPRPALGPGLSDPSVASGGSEVGSKTQADALTGKSIAGAEKTAVGRARVAPAADPSGVLALTAEVPQIFPRVGVFDIADPKSQTLTFKVSKLPKKDTRVCLQVLAHPACPTCVNPTGHCDDPGHYHDFSFYGGNRDGNKDWSYDDAAGQWIGIISYQKETYGIAGIQARMVFAGVGGSGEIDIAHAVDAYLSVVNEAESENPPNALACYDSKLRLAFSSYGPLTVFGPISRRFGPPLPTCETQRPGHACTGEEEGVCGLPSSHQPNGITAWQRLWSGTCKCITSWNRGGQPCDLDQDPDPGCNCNYIPGAWDPPQEWKLVCK